MENRLFIGSKFESRRWVKDFYGVRLIRRTKKRKYQIHNGKKAKETYKTLADCKKYFDTDSCELFGNEEANADWADEPMVQTYSYAPGTKEKLLKRFEKGLNERIRRRTRRSNSV